MSTPWQKTARARMREKGVIQQDVADTLGVTKGTVSSWFSGRYQPAPQQLERIAKMLEISLAELLSEDDALARNSVELSILRRARKVPPEKLKQAEALIAAVLATLAEPEQTEE